MKLLDLFRRRRVEPEPYHIIVDRLARRLYERVREIDIREGRWALPFDDLHVSNRERYFALANEAIRAGAK